MEVTVKCDSSLFSSNISRVRADIFLLIIFSHCAAFTAHIFLIQIKDQHNLMVYASLLHALLDVLKRRELHPWDFERMAVLMKT